MKVLNSFESLTVWRPILDRYFDENNGGLARHSGLRQRKVKEGIESLREIHRGMKVLNSFESLTVWRPILDRYFDENKHARARAF